MSKELSLIPADAKAQLEYLKGSRLPELITDEKTRKRMFEAAVNLLTDEKLRKCNPLSILGALYKAFRLESDFGECHLIPRFLEVGKDKDKKPIKEWTACFQIGFKGWKAIALQTGHIKFIQAKAVRKGDVFEYEFGTRAFIRHRPADETEGSETHFYARAELTKGGELFEVITRQDAEENRKYSASQYETLGVWPNQEKRFYKDPVDIWAKNYAAMALRRPIKTLCQALPLSAAMDIALQADGAVTYLQKDGTQTTILPADVEKSAEQIEEAKALPADIGEAYEELKLNLGGIHELPHLIKFYNDFSTGEHGKNKVMITPFFDRAADLAETRADVVAFYNAAAAWKQQTDLYKILQTRIAEIEAPAAK
jgi:phage RecT family recombinase